MKRLCVLIVCFCLCMFAVMGEVIHAQESVDWPGQADPEHIAHSAYVLCESLTVRESPEYGAKTLKILLYGQTFLTVEKRNGWLNVTNESGTENGWVRAEYVLEEPDYLVLDKDAKAYACDDETAPVVGYLDKGTKLAIIRTDPCWYLVSLRGAVAWIRRTDTKYAGEPKGFDLSQLSQLTRADLRWWWNGKAISYSITDADKLNQLTALLTDAEDQKVAMAGCPFGLCLLTLTRFDGTQVSLDMAADDCCIFRVDGRDFKYAVSRRDDVNGGPINDILSDLFGGKPERE